jgi:hypothetical protein
MGGGCEEEGTKGMTSTEVDFRETCGGVRVRGGRCQESRCCDTHALFSSQ